MKQSRTNDHTIQELLSVITEQNKEIYLLKTINETLEEMLLSLSEEACENGNVNDFPFTIYYSPKIFTVITQREEFQNELTCLIKNFLVLYSCDPTLSHMTSTTSIGRVRLHKTKNGITIMLADEKC